MPHYRQANLRHQQRLRHRNISSNSQRIHPTFEPCHDWLCANVRGQPPTRQPANPVANAIRPLVRCVAPSRLQRVAVGGMVGKDERGIAHPNVETSIVAQDGEWRYETTTPGEELFTRCMETGRGWCRGMSGCSGAEIGRVTQHSLFHG
jgi:hypothetical protein